MALLSAMKGKLISVIGDEVRGCKIWALSMGVWCFCVGGPKYLVNADTHLQARTLVRKSYNLVYFTI